MELKDNQWHKLFLGVRQQHNYMLYQFIDDVLKNTSIERFVEIGTGAGALSVVLGLHAVIRDTHLLTLDTQVRGGKYRLDKVFDALEIEFVQEDCFENVERILKHIDGKPCFFFCDGGNKSKEFNTFAPLLPAGSIIAVHDYETKEIRAKDIEEVAKAFTPVLEKYWREEKFDIRTCFYKKEGVMKYDKYGIPIDERSMRIVNDSSRKKRHPARVKDSIWRNEKKPWGGYPGRASSHPSVEIHYLYRKGLEFGGNIANLGVWRGASTNALATGVKERGEGKVYAIDFFEESAWRIEYITDIFKERGTLPWVEFCKGHTQDWAKTLENLRFNFIFVDADHQYESCKRDFETWEPLLAPGGEISFHDIGLNTVDKVITE